VALALAATGALLLLGVDQNRPRPALLSVDVALAGSVAALVAWACGPALGDGPVDVTQVVRLTAGSVLLGVCVLDLSGVSRRGRRPVGFPPELPAGLGLLGLSLSLGVVARSAEQPALARPTGAAAFAGLALLVLAAVRVLRPVPDAVGAPSDDPEPDTARPGAPLALSVPPVVGVGVLSGAALSGAEVDPLGAVLVTAVVLLSWVRLLVVVGEGRARLLHLAEDERQMRHQAFHDQLTGLANRQLFHDRLGHALAVHRRSRRPLALLFGDLDGFKAVNDRHGHDAGDLVLRSVAERLAACLRPTDTLARLGGDEFAVLLDDGAQPDVVVERLLSALQDGDALPPGAASVRMSLGVAVVGADDPTPSVEELLARADAAMYSAKHSARRTTTSERPDRAGPAEVPADDLPPGPADDLPPDDPRARCGRRWPATSPPAGSTSCTSRSSTRPPGRWRAWRRSPAGSSPASRCLRAPSWPWPSRPACAAGSPTWCWTAPGPSSACGRTPSGTTG
jgi:diguanylate cyclase (GGDEF)-like protein